MKQFFVLTLIATLLSSPALAQQLTFGGVEQDPDAPIEVVSEQLDVNQTDGSAVFTGDVVVVQGLLQLSAQRVEVYYTEGGGEVETMIATVDVVLINGTEAAEAERADYAVKDGVVVMTGNVLVTQGPSAVAGDRMTVQIDTGKAKIEGRVRTLLKNAPTE